jgi:hypothetical protein
MTIWFTDFRGKDCLHCGLQDVTLLCDDTELSEEYSASIFGVEWLNLTWTWSFRPKDVGRRVWPPKTSIPIYKTTRCHIPEDAAYN